MSKIEKLRKKAEDAWTDCDSCNSNDKSMWINGYLVGALANQIELPTDEEIEMAAPYVSRDAHDYYVGDRDGFIQGAQWMRDKIQGGQDNE